MKDRLLLRQQEQLQQQLQLQQQEAVVEVFPSSHPSAANHVTTSVFGEGALRSSPLDKPEDIHVGANVGAGKKKKNKHKK